MDNKVVIPALIVGLLSFGVQAQHEKLQALPDDIDLSSAEISLGYLQAELGEDFVSDVFGGEVACNTKNNAISAFGEMVDFHNNPADRFVLKTLDFSETKTSYIGDRTNIGHINAVVLDPVLSAGLYEQRTSKYGEYCRKFNTPNLIQHVNANTILASWIYKNREIL